MILSVIRTAVCNSLFRSERQQAPKSPNVLPAAKHMCGAIFLYTIFPFVFSRIDTFRGLEPECCYIARILTRLLL